ncbi:hypothetical protein, partial [Micromonospora sp.]|uniref:hypothetical protein n=1 Tax=Micromonospora sp. TaxID=1876 RepID=UPI003B3AFE70
MTDTWQGAPRVAADLRAMRLFTVLSLGLGMLIGGVVQVLLGVGVAGGSRTVVLVVATTVAVLAGLAAIPLLLRGPDEVPPGHPLVLVLLALAGAVWVLAVVPPFAGWGWAFTLAMAGGVLSCLVRERFRVTVILGTWAVIGLGGLIGVLTTVRVGPPPDAAADAIVLSTVAVFTLLPLSAVWVQQVVLRLEHARRLASDLAVARERLRFAADLHDIQGLPLLRYFADVAVSKRRRPHNIGDIESISTSWRNAGGSRRPPGSTCYRMNPGRPETCAGTRYLPPSRSTCPPRWISLRPTGSRRGSAREPARRRRCLAPVAGSLGRVYPPPAQPR